MPTQPVDIGIEIQLKADTIEWGKVDVAKIGKELEKKLAPLKDSIKNIFESANIESMSDKAYKAFERLQKSSEKLNKAQQRYNELTEKAAKSNPEYKRQYADIQKRIAAITKESNREILKLENNPQYQEAKYKQKHGLPITKEEQRMIPQFEELIEKERRELAEAIADLEKQLPNAADFTSEVSPEWQRKLQEAYRNVGVAASQAAQDEQKYNEEVENSEKQASKASKAVKKLGSAFVTLVGILGKLGKKLVINPIVSGFKKLANTVSRKVVGAFKSLTKHTTSANKSMTRLFKNIMQFGLGFRSLFFLIKSLRNLFVEQFKEMAKQISEVNLQISSFITATNQLKGSLATAFQPLVSFIIPYLNIFIAKLAEAMIVIGKFFATLTGSGKIFKFTARNVDYATESMSSGSSAAEEYKNQLLGFDEINRLEDNTGSSGGGSSDLVDGTWVEEPLEAQNTLAELMKEGWANSDFTEVGKYLGKQLELALDTAYEYLSTKVAPFVQKLSQVLVTGINGFFDMYGTAMSLGKTLGTAIQIAVDGLHTFLTQIDFSGIGVWFATAVNTAIQQIDFYKVGETITAFFHNMLTGIESFLKNIRLSGLTTALEVMINNIDVELLLTDLNNLLFRLGEILGELPWYEIGYKIGEYVSGIDWSTVFSTLIDIIIQTLQGLYDGTDWGKLGEDLINGLGEGIKAAFGLITQVLSDLKDWVVEKIREKFSMHSPSLVMAELGNQLIAGLVQGLEEKFESITTTIENITGLFDDLINYIKTTFSQGWNSAWETISQKFSSTWEQIKNAVREPVNTIISWINSLLQGLSNAFQSIARTLNSWQLDIPEWVPIFGGGSFHFNLPYLDFGSITPLAQGAVIPPNNEFLALLGDQSSGTNVEAPLSTIQQAVAEVFASGDMYDMIVAAIESALENKPNPVIENKVYLDSRQIKAGQDRLARATGI